MHGKKKSRKNLYCKILEKKKLLIFLLIKFADKPTTLLLLYLKL
jgi:hypothetical protein